MKNGGREFWCCFDALDMLAIRCKVIVSEQFTEEVCMKLIWHVLEERVVTNDVIQCHLADDAILNRLRVHWENDSSR